MRFFGKMMLGLAGLGLALTVRADEAPFYFATGSAQLKNRGAFTKLVRRAGEGATFHISGHTDPRGSDEVNRRLRAERSEAAKSALVAAGVDEAHITVEEGSAESGSPKDYWKLRRAVVSYEGGHPAAQAAGSQTPRSEDRHADAEQKKAEAEQRRAEAEQKKSESAEQKKAEAEQRRAEAEQKKSESAEQKKAEAEQRRLASAATTNPRANDSGEEKPTESTSSTRKLEPVKLIYWKSLNHALWIIAKQKGYFEQEGFDVSLEETDDDARKIAAKVELAPGVMSTSALNKGQRKYMAGAVCGYAAHEAMARNESIVDIGSMIMNPLVFIMKKELAEQVEKDIRAFKGQRIGDETYGAGPHEFRYNNVIRVELEKNGLKDGQDFKITEYDTPSDNFKALVDGKVDVIIMVPPEDIGFVRSHPGYVRIPIARFFPYLPCCRQLITRHQLKTSREKYVRLLRASIRAHEFTIEHSKEAAEIIAKWLNLSPSVVRASIMSPYVTLTPDPMRKGVELYQRTNDRFVGKKTSTAEFIDTSLYRDALLSLAKENTDENSKGYFETMISRFRANN